MDDFSRYILSINTESLDGVMYRLFVQAYSNLNDYPDPDSNRVSLLNVLNLMRMSPVAKQDFMVCVKRTVLHRLLEYFQSRHAVSEELYEAPGEMRLVLDLEYGTAVSPVLDLSKTIRLCAGANCAELGSRYIKFALITDKVLNKRGGLCQKKVIIERSIMLSAGTFH